jgi:hypothetical protein
MFKWDMQMAQKSPTYIHISQSNTAWKIELPDSHAQQSRWITSESSMKIVSVLIP